MDKEKLIIGGVIALVIVIIIALIIGGTYNTLVSSDVNVENAAAKVQAAYQRRADLIPQLVSTVEASAVFEKNTQTQIAEMRSQAATIQNSMNKATTLNEMQRIDKESISDPSTGFLARFNMVVENYPQLTSTQNFRDLQSQLEGTENRIQYERNEYSAAVANYKTVTRAFPTGMIAGWFGFRSDKWAMFEADAGSQVAPKVTFSAIVTH
jgi:LemA protein